MELFETFKESIENSEVLIKESDELKEEVSEFLKEKIKTIHEKTFNKDDIEKLRIAFKHLWKVVSAKGKTCLRSLHQPCIHN